MYEERTDTFSVKDLVMLVLVIAFFVFLFMWIFPTKDKKANDKQAKQKETKVKYDRVFNENIVTLKEGAKKYYTEALLPEKVGDKTTITLQELIDGEFMSPLKDSKKKVCNGKDSYVELTKTENDYAMKVNLKCSKVENYLLVYMGKYDYCETTICEKNKEDVENPIVRETEVTSTETGITGMITGVTNRIIDVACTECKPKPSNPNTGGGSSSVVPTTPPNPVTPPSNKVYQCEYIKVSNVKYTDWSSWSSWVVEEQLATPLKQVRSKTDRVTVTKTILTGHNVITYKDPNKPIYKQSQVQTGTKKELKCTAYGANNVCAGYSEVETPVYSIVNILVGYGTSERKEPVYRYDTVTEDKKFYSYRTRSITVGNKDVKWDICEGSSLLNNGYSKTGATR